MGFCLLANSASNFAVCLFLGLDQVRDVVIQQSATGSVDVSDDSLKRRELVQPKLLHNCRILRTETLVVFTRPPRGATSIHEWMFRNHQPPLHFLANQDFPNLRSRVHFLISPRKNKCPARSYADSGAAYCLMKARFSQC